MAPLTAPATRGKSRPLYLAPGPGGLSASYSDTNPELKGRKFYWHQRPPGNELVWEGHKQEPARHVQPQLPPPIMALKSGETFRGRIQFENLTDQELGALLYALKGPNGAHALHVGKGKPRGLGSLQVTQLDLRLWNPESDYTSLLVECTAQAARPEDAEGFVAKFKTWVLEQPGQQGKRFDELGHIRDFNRLHAWPGQQRICYYPINFSNYGWLPDQNRNPDEPSVKRPEAMKRARDL
jgi:CRISPR-associated protein (TIGR03986 family)